jgi:hypothetical protein
VTPAVARDLVDGASWLLYSFLNGQFTAGDTWRDEYATSRCGIRLRHAPVESVTSVERVDSCGANPETVEWCMLDASLVKVCDQLASGSYDYRRNFGQAPPCGGDVTRYVITYVQGDNLPPGAAGMATLLAEEALKAQTGQECKLPDRIQTVTRQGVSWTIFDPQDFLEKGGVGISSVDLWLSAARRWIGGVARDPLEGLLLDSQIITTVAPLAVSKTMTAQPTAMTRTMQAAPTQLTATDVVLVNAIRRGWTGTWTGVVLTDGQKTADIAVTSKRDGYDVTLTLHLPSGTEGEWIVSHEGTMVIGGKLPSP